MSSLLRASTWIEIVFENRVPVLALYDVKGREDLSNAALAAEVQERLEDCGWAVTVHDFRTDYDTKGYHKIADISVAQAT